MPFYVMKLVTDLCMYICKLSTVFSVFLVFFSFLLFDLFSKMEAVKSWLLNFLFSSILE